MFRLGVHRRHPQCYPTFCFSDCRYGNGHAGGSIEETKSIPNLLVVSANQINRIDESRVLSV